MPMRAGGFPPRVVITYIALICLCTGVIASSGDPDAGKYAAWGTGLGWCCACGPLTLPVTANVTPLPDLCLCLQTAAPWLTSLQRSVAVCPPART